MMDQEGQNNSGLDAVTNVESDNDTNKSSSSPTAALVGAAGQESADPTIQLASEHGQFKNICDQLKELQKKTAMQCYDVEYYEEPEKEEIKKLADGLSEIGKRLVAVCDEEKASLSGIRESNDNGEIQIQNEPIIIETQLKNLIERVYFRTIDTINIYTDLTLNYKGQLSVLGDKMRDRLHDRLSPIKSSMWIHSRASGNDDNIANQPTLVNMLDELRNMGVDLELYGTEMMQSIDSSRYIFRIIKFDGPNFYKRFIVSQVLSLILYMSDVFSDVWLAFNYLSEGEILFFGLTVSFVVIPSIIISRIAYLWSTKWEFWFRKTIRIHDKN